MPPLLNIQQWIFISSAFSFLLLLARIFISHRFSYAFLAWNLLLAYVPLFLSNWLTSHPQLLKEKMRFMSLVLLWLLFMPNTFYIVTDLFHLQNSKDVHPWFDLVLILSFAWNGILFGIISIRQMEILLKQAKGKIIPGLVICIVMWLNAFGVYIGRFLRFNSWDVIVKPMPLLDGLATMITDPYDYKHAWAMCACFAVFMIIIYYTMKKLTEVFQNG